MLSFIANSKENGSETGSPHFYQGLFIVNMKLQQFCSRLGDDQLSFYRPKTQGTHPVNQSDRGLFSSFCG